mgnify:FL=1
METAFILTAIITGLLLLSLFSKKTINKIQSEVSETKLTPQEFIDKYNEKQGLVKGGSLCFFGHWFGRPHDNYHILELVTYNSSTNSLTFNFNENETLTIFNAQGISEFSNQLIIYSADKIYWEWYYYGKVQTKDTKCFIEILRQDNILTGKTNSDSTKDEFKDLDIKRPALLWI